VYEHQGEMTAENFKNKILEWSKGKKIDGLQLGRCMETKSTEPEVDKSMADALSLHVNSTPTLFVNGRKLASQVGWPDLRSIIDNEIEYQKTAKNAGEDCGCEVKLPSPTLK
jgi:protein-disulfide isomerase